MRKRKEKIFFHSNFQKGMQCWNFRLHNLSNKLLYKIQAVTFRGKRGNFNFFMIFVVAIISRGNHLFLCYSYREFYNLRIINSLLRIVFASSFQIFQYVSTFEHTNTIGASLLLITTPVNSLTTQQTFMSGLNHI